jgi:hypothetical protein
VRGLSSDKNDISGEKGKKNVELTLDVGKNLSFYAEKKTCDCTINKNKGR